MLLAIDVGNTQTVYGLRRDGEWIATWRRSTSPDDTEDQLAGWLRLMFEMSGLEFRVDQAVCASVVPAMDTALERLGEKWLKGPVKFLRKGSDVGLEVEYVPPTGVGADRIANALAAKAAYGAPAIIVDFGTATTFDVLDGRGVYIGGAIMTGVAVSASALAGRTAKLPQVELKAPETAIGRNTVDALQSGIMIGYAGAVDALAGRIREELGADAPVIATGGLASEFVGLAKTIDHHAPHLTLDGLALAAEIL